MADNKNDNQHSSHDAAADLIRQKINQLYGTEPNATEEAVEASLEPARQRSKHQQFMYDLSTSGKSLADIQVAWHNYYLGLNDEEKHQVWKEFYAANEKQSALFKTQAQAAVLPPQPATGNQESAPAVKRTGSDPPKSVSELKKQIVSKVRVRGKLTRRQNLQSVAFGLGMGAVVMLFLLFGLFNERFIAPFITPSRNVSATPLIIDPNNSSVGREPKVIIPKINVEVPVVYDVNTIEERSVQDGLNRGVVHYATTSNPGEKGNAVIFGHSSNNILNKGRFKFAFVLLSRMEKGDTFYLQKDGVRYVYKIFEKKIVSPTEFSVLEPIPKKTAVATLITCDPPGTTLKRLIVHGEQISPSPSGNKKSTALKTDQRPKILAGNAQSLWSRIVDWIF